jgi:hypothetical protein
VAARQPLVAACGSSLRWRCRTARRRRLADDGEFRREAGDLYPHPLLDLYAALFDATAQSDTAAAPAPSTLILMLAGLGLSVIDTAKARMQATYTLSMADGSAEVSIPLVG